MKKVISIALAVLMMFAVCVPAFAADADKVISNEAPDAQTATVKTTTDGSESNYSVTFPAETLIAWGEPSTNITYKVSAQLEPNKYLAVSVTGDGNMTDANSRTLAYTLGGETTFNTTANTVVKDVAKTLTVDVAADAWNNAVISEYSGTLTFTAEVK